MRGMAGRVAKLAARCRKRRRGSCMTFPPGERSYAGLRCSQSPLLLLHSAAPSTEILRVLPKCLGMKFHAKETMFSAKHWTTWSITMNTVKLDPREEHHRIAGPHSGLSLFLRYLPPR